MKKLSLQEVLEGIEDTRRERWSFFDKQFKCLLDEAFLDKIVQSAFCS